MITVTLYVDDQCSQVLRSFQVRNSDEALDTMVETMRAGGSWKTDLRQADEEEKIIWPRIELAAVCMRALENDGQVRLDDRCFNAGNAHILKVICALAEASQNHTLYVNDDNPFDIRVTTRSEYRA